jgi:hypothetical protein
MFQLSEMLQQVELKTPQLIKIKGKVKTGDLTILPWRVILSLKLSRILLMLKEL